VQIWRLAVRLQFNRQQERQPQRSQIHVDEEPGYWIRHRLPLSFIAL
jgi:hypothetical protein